jgi:small neutral amino acid transporter SnatA (MarC family)
MDFLKKVILSSVAYFIIVLLWIFTSEQMLNLWLLTIQSLCFGIIAGGCLYFISVNKNSVSGNTDLKDEKPKED